MALVYYDDEVIHNLIKDASNLDDATEVTVILRTNLLNFTTQKSEKVFSFFL